MAALKIMKNPIKSYIMYSTRQNGRKIIPLQNFCFRNIFKEFIFRKANLREPFYSFVSAI